MSEGLGNFCVKVQQVSRDPMFPLDPLWFCISVPATIIFLLILVKLGQRKIKPRVSAWTERVDDGQASQHKKTLIPKRAIDEEGLGEVTNPSNAESPEDPKLGSCTKFLGYLYLKNAPSETRVPNECHNCPKFLQCLYSPCIIEKVYGE
jgi:hypothetical protein